VLTAVDRRGRSLLLELFKPLKSGVRLSHASGAGVALHCASLLAHGPSALFNTALRRPPLRVSVTMTSASRPNAGQIAQTFGKHLVTTGSRAFIDSLSTVRVENESECWGVSPTPFLSSAATTFMRSYGSVEYASSAGLLVVSVAIRMIMVPLPAFFLFTAVPVF
jgi:hypothetical protein